MFWVLGKRQTLGTVHFTVLKFSISILEQVSPKFITEYLCYFHISW